MIYTVGHKISYDCYLASNDFCKKKGRTVDYPGGSVWKTFEEANKHAKDGYAVYGVLADWEKDTEQSQDGEWHDLLVSSIIVRLI